MRETEIVRCIDCAGGPAYIALAKGGGMICARCFVNRLEQQATDAERAARKARAATAGSTLYHVLARH